MQPAATPSIRIPHNKNLFDPSKLWQYERNIVLGRRAETDPYFEYITTFVVNLIDNTTDVVFNAGMSKQATKIPDAERDVLVCLNRLEQATVKDIREELMPVRELDVSSVLTLLNRLESKKLVARRKADKGKAFVFRPTAASRKACRQLMKDLFQHVFAGDTRAFMASFFETRKPTDSEIDQLQELLDDLKTEKKGKRS